MSSLQQAEPRGLLRVAGRHQRWPGSDPIVGDYPRGAIRRSTVELSVLLGRNRRSHRGAFRPRHPGRHAGRLDASAPGSLGGREVVSRGDARVPQEGADAPEVTGVRTWKAHECLLFGTGTRGASERAARETGESRSQVALVAADAGQNDMDILRGERDRRRRDRCACLACQCIEGPPGSRKFERVLRDWDILPRQSTWCTPRLDTSPRR